MVEVNPAAFLPALARSLHNLSERLTDNEQAGTIAVVWREAIDAIAHPAARAELRAAWAARLATMQLPDQARGELQRAATEADKATAEGGLPDRASTVLLMRARAAVRSQAHALGLAGDQTLPVWAAAPLPQPHVDLVNAVVQAPDWPAARSALEQHLELLESAELRMSLQALAGLYPGHPGPGRLLSLLDEIDASGADAVFQRHQEAHEQLALINAWVATPTWSESRDFLVQHQDRLTTAETRQTLASIDAAVARQHLAILDLAAATTIDAAYVIITDAGTAEEAAFDALESGDLTRLAAIATATPALEDRPTTAALLDAVLLLARDEQHAAHELGQQLAGNADTLQRRAHTIRLRNLRKHHPDLPGLDHLIDIVDPGADRAAETLP